MAAKLQSLGMWHGNSIHHQLLKHPWPQVVEIRKALRARRLLTAGFPKALSFALSPTCTYEFAPYFTATIYPWAFGGGAPPRKCAFVKQQLVGKQCIKASHYLLMLLFENFQSDLSSAKLGGPVTKLAFDILERTQIFLSLSRPLSLFSKTMPYLEQAVKSARALLVPLPGCLHYTPEHCLVNCGFPLFWC